MFKGTPLRCWKERHEEAPVSAVKEGWVLPGDTQVLKPLEGHVKKPSPHRLLAPPHLIPRLCKRVPCENSPADKTGSSVCTDFYKLNL